MRATNLLYYYYGQSKLSTGHGIGANVGLDSSVGRAPARQSGGRRFKSRSSKFFFVHPNLSKICTQSVSLVVYYMIFIFKKLYPIMVHPLLPVPRLYRNLGVIPG